MKIKKNTEIFEVLSTNHFWKWHRKCKKFLLFPKTIGNEKRWLEIAEWEEFWQDNPFLTHSDDNSIPYEKWIPFKWLN